MGGLSPLLVRPIPEQGFEIVLGGEAYRAAHIAEVDPLLESSDQATHAHARGRVACAI